MEQEYIDAAKKDSVQNSFSKKARFVLAMVDKRLASKIRDKHEKAKNKFFL
tara:strand:+ start:495 stop:647 length:153 start_codon:yes stop_codon:yes gene_type:complete